MAIAFTYDESDNKVVVTGGTSGTPATFANFVTADRAGTAELTPEDAPVAISADPTSFSLTYAVRPVEDLAVQLTITASADKVGATLDIDGDDWKGSHQDDDAIDISGAATTPVVTTTYWSAIDANGITVNGITDGTTIKITQGSWGVIWDYGNYQYKVDASVDFGDDSTSTYFTSQRDNVFWSTGAKFVIKGEATLQIGDIENSYATYGSYWNYGPSESGQDTVQNHANAATKIYGSIFYLRVANSPNWNNGTFTMEDSILTSGFTGSGSSNWRFIINCTNTIRNVLITDCYDFMIKVAPTSISGLHTHQTNNGLYSTQTTTVTDLLVTNPVTRDVLSIGANISLVDPRWHPSTMYISANGNWIKEIYTCNISVADKDGTLIDDVIVDCEDTDGTAVWTAGSVLTGATNTGEIDEQQITYKRWIDTTETLKTYSPHKFTLSRAGYETLVLDNVTVDGAIDWHLELKDIDVNEMQEETFMIDTVRTYLDN